MPGDPVGSKTGSIGADRAGGPERGVAMSASRRSQAEDESRRRFLHEAIITPLALAGASATGARPCPGSPLGDDNSGPIDCGPPPKAKAQHRTGGESSPPSPARHPAAAHEKKRPPAPPALIGKMGLGPIRWITKDGKRVQYRDWMTDPADVDTLL